MEDKKIAVGFLETHFYFYDKSHSMNAYVKNKCDSALLNIISEVSKELGVEKSLTVEVLPPTEGSLVEWIEFFCSPGGAVTTIGAGAALVTCLIDIIARVKTTPPPLPLQDPLDIENKNLDIQKKKLEIELLKRELLDSQIGNGKFDDKSQIKSVKEKIEDSKDIIYHVLINNLKIRKNLSIFYENLITYQKIESVGCTTYDNKLNVMLAERVVKRENFGDFIINLNEFEEIDEDAKIIIYSPNLVKGRHKWRGLYIKLDKIIDFSMKDSDFKRDVESGTITFKNGSTIRAVLTTKIKMDMTGAESSRTYAVEKVLRYTHDKGYTDTTQGREYKANKKDVEAQISFPFDDKN